MQYETFVISARDSSHKYTPQGVQLLSSESATTATGGQGRTDRHQQNFQCEYPLTSRPGAGSCDEPATKLKLGVVGSEAKLGRARTTPAAGAGERSTQREPWEAASSPPCRAAPTTAAAGCRATVGHHVQEGAARAQAGGRRCRAASCCRSSSRAQSGPAVEHQRSLSAQVAGRRRLDRETRIGGGATAVPVRGCSGCARRGVGSQPVPCSSSVLEGGDGGLAVGQVVERLPRHGVARRVQACHGPAHRYVPTPMSRHSSS